MARRAPCAPRARIVVDPRGMVELVDEWGEVVRSVIFAPSTAGSACRAVAMLLTEGRALGYAVEPPRDPA